MTDAGDTREQLEDRTSTEIDFTDYIEVDFPNWALCTLVNGDPLEDATDINDYGAWEKSMLEQGYDLISFDVTDDTNDFCSHPEFGLACDTTKVRFFKRKEKRMTDKANTVYVVQDCVEDDSGDRYHFKCDAQVRLTLDGAKELAWNKFTEHYKRLAGRKPVRAMKDEFDSVISDGCRCYTCTATLSHEITVEILEREAV